MKQVYFDRNVFSALAQLEDGITTEDVQRVTDAVAGGRVNVLGSFPLFEETVTMFGKSEEGYLHNLSTMLDIIDHRRMVKPVDQLIAKDCYDYAVGLPENDRSMRTPVWLKEFLDFPLNHETALRELVRNIKEYRGRSAANITEGLLNAREAGLRRAAGRPRNFNHLWEGLGEIAVKFWVEKSPREIRKKCYKRGLSKMLRVKSIRFFALYYLSVMQTGWFGLEGVPRKVKHGDIGDMFHAISASAAEWFVTQESKVKPGHLGYILSLKPTENFEVLNIDEFLRRIA